MGADAGQTGEAVSVVHQARQSSQWLDTARSQRPAFPEVSQTGVGGQVAEEIPDVLAGTARPVGLRTVGRLRLNYSTAGHRFYLAGLRLGACFGFSGSLDLLDRFEELALKFRPACGVQVVEWVGLVVFALRLLTIIFSDHFISISLNHFSHFSSIVKTVHSRFHGVFIDTTVTASKLKFTNLTLIFCVYC